jgi:hypothetical protein
MTCRFQFAQRLQASAPLFPATGVIEPKSFTYPCGQSASVLDFVALKQIANAFYVRGLRQSPFDLALCVHAIRMHGMNPFVQYLIKGKGQA